MGGVVGMADLYVDPALGQPITFLLMCTDLTPAQASLWDGWHGVYFLEHLSD